MTKFFLDDKIVQNFSIMNVSPHQSDFMDELKISKSIKDYGVSKADFEKELETVRVVVPLFDPDEFSNCHPPIGVD